MSGSYADDILQAGTEEEKKNMQQKVKENFDATFSNKNIYFHIHWCES